MNDEAQKGGIIGGTLVTVSILFLLLLLGVLIFGGGSETTPSITNNVQSKQQTGRCETPSEILVNKIASGLKTNGTGSLRNAHAVRSSDFEKVWFVAADIQASGLEGSNDIGVWAVNEIDGSPTASIISAEAVAREFTNWGTAGDFSERSFSSSNDGFQEAKQCAGGR